MRSVCRVEVGSTLRVGMINGTLGTATVTSAGNNCIECSVVLGEPPPPPLPLTLILAMPRPKSLKKALESAAALGIKKIYLIETWRVEKSYWTSPVLNTESLNKHLLLGLEQGRDTIVPEISIRKRFKPFVEDELEETGQYVVTQTSLAVDTFEIGEIAYSTKIQRISADGTG